MATIDELSVRVTADTANFRAGAALVDDALDDLSGQAARTAGALEFLSSRSNDAEGEVRELGRASSGSSRRLGLLSGSAASTAASMTGMSAAANAASFSFTSLSSTPLLVVLPALTAAATALLSVLFPLAAAAGVVAAAFGGIGLVAFAGTAAAAATHTEVLKSALSSVKEELLEVLKPLADLFLPMIQSLLYDIPDVVEETLALTGSLEEFRNSIWFAARAFMDVVPEMLATLVEFGEIALPILRRFFQRIEGDVRPAMMGMLQATRAIAPELMRFGRAFMNALPELTRLGIVVLNTVVPALTGFLTLVEDIVQMGQQSSGFVGFLRRGVTDLAMWVENTGRPLLAGVGESLLDVLTSAFEPGGGGRGVVSSIGSWLVGVLGDLSTWLQNQGIAAFGDIALDILGMLGDSLAGISGSDVSTFVRHITGLLGTGFNQLVSILRSGEANAVSKQMGRIAVSILGSLVEEMIAYARSDQFEKDLEALGDVVANVAGGVLEGAVREAFSFSVGNVNFDLREDRGGGAFVPEAEGQSTVTPTNGNVGSTELADANVTVTVEGDTEVIRDVSADVVSQEQRRTRERQGRNPTPR